MLRHAQEAHDLILKRQAEKEATEKRLLEEAEATLRQYLTCETEHPEIVEQLADAATLLGWHPAVLTAEGAINAQLIKAFEELDTLEYRYREAAAKHKERAEQLRQRGSGRAVNEEMATRELDHLASHVDAAAAAHESRRKRLVAWQATWRFPRPIPARYQMGLQNLVASSHPPAELPLSERNKPEPLRIPERPDYYDLLEKGEHAAEAARVQVYKQATDNWEAAAQQGVEQHEAKVTEHEAWMQEQKARELNAKQKTADAGS